MTDGRVVRRWRRQRGCSPRRDAHRPSNRSRAARPSLASFDLPATPKTSTTPCSSVLFNSPPSSSFGLRMPRILKALEERTREKRTGLFSNFSWGGKSRIRYKKKAFRTKIFESIFQSLTSNFYSISFLVREKKKGKNRISIEQL